MCQPAGGESRKSSVRVLRGSGFGPQLCLFLRCDPGRPAPLSLSFPVCKKRVVVWLPGNVAVVNKSDGQSGNTSTASVEKAHE